MTDLAAAIPLKKVQTVADSFLPFDKMISNYECALLEVRTKLDILNKELSLTNNHTPFEDIKYRIKSSKSILEKAKKLGIEQTVKSIEENLTDIAGIRVICAFEEDIYLLSNYLINQDDVNLIMKKDYIKNPKPNGYRSLHLILDVPIFLTSEKKRVKVEVQFRTIAMDFWASVEHRLKYKKDIKNQEELVERLRVCALNISNLDKEMSEIKKIIEN